METLHLFLNDKSKAHFTLEDISILNDQLMGFYYIDKENPTKEEEMEQFKNHIVNFKENNTIFESVKDSLLFDLNEYKEKDTMEDDNFTYYADSVAEQEEHNNNDVYELTEKLRELSNEEIIQVLTALMEARTFFELFIISDPMKDLAKYKKMAEVYEHGYDVYKEGYETLNKFVNSENLDKMANKISNNVKERIDLVKDTCIDAINGKTTVKN